MKKTIKYNGKFISFGSNGISLIHYDDSIVTETPISEEVEYNPSNAVSWNIHKFNDLSTIYQSLHKGDKLSLVIRHGERNDSNSSSSEPITQRGQVALLVAGKKMTGNADFESGITPNDFKLFGSTAIRTSHTAILLAKGRGCDTDSLMGVNTIDYCKNTNGNTQQEYFNNSTNKVIDTSQYSWLTGDKWEIGSSDWNTVAKTSYERDMTDKFNTFIEWVLSNSTASINIFGSHDFNMMPTVLSVAKQGKTNQAEYIQPDLTFWSNSNWIAYAAGIAIIVRAGDTNKEHIEIVPIKTLTNIEGNTWNSTKVSNMRNGVSNDYHPNNGYKYAYDVNGQIQYDITTYSDTLQAHEY